MRPAVIHWSVQWQNGRGEAFGFESSCTWLYLHCLLWSFSFVPPLSTYPLSVFPVSYSRVCASGTSFRFCFKLSLPYLCCWSLQPLAGNVRGLAPCAFQSHVSAFLRAVSCLILSTICFPWLLFVFILSGPASIPFPPPSYPSTPWPHRAALPAFPLSLSCAALCCFVVFTLTGHSSSLV